MIALIDYGIGNLRSVEKALRTAGGDVLLSDNPAEIVSAEKLILPGVGAFGDGMAGLIERDFVDLLKERVKKGIPIIGICLGMQLLLNYSEEDPGIRGLGFISGDNRLFASDDLKVPQTGWNQIFLVKESPILEGLDSGCFAYFNHSYYCEPPQSSIIATTDYGFEYASIIGSKNIFGVQFHPEKSQDVGLRLLENFVNFNPII